MSIIAEQNQWFKDKKGILDEFSDSHRALLSVVASRNFLKAPGFLLEASIGLEEVSKNKLSALNYQIVAEAIERELKQIGHDYSQAYKSARIVFALEKQTLLTELQQEFADLDAAQSLSEEEVNRQYVELDLRRIILITTKTAIDLELEGLRQELIDIDRLTFANEILLMEEKVATAELKLTIIPYIEAIIIAQERVLVAEEANIPYTEDLIDEKGLLIEKKEEVLPFIEDKAEARMRLANKKEEVLPYIEDKIDSQIELVEKKEEMLPFIEDRANAQIQLANKEEEVLPFIEDKIAAQTALIEKKEEVLPYKEDKVLTRQQLASKREEVLPYIVDKAASLIAVAEKEEEILPFIEDTANAKLGLAIKKGELLSYMEDKVDAQVALAIKKEEVLPYIEEEANARIAAAGKQRELLPFIEDKIDALEALIIKKEEILPYMEDKALMRQQLAAKKEEVLPYMEDKANALIELAAKEEEILPYIEDKAEKLLSLAEAILAAILIEEQRIDVVVSKADLKMDAVDNTLAIIEAEKALEILRVLLSLARQDLQITQIDKQISLTDLSSTNINEISTERTGMMGVLERYKTAIASSIRNARGITVDEDIDGDERANDLSVEAERLATYYIAQYQKDARVESAEISAAADITSKLIHLIGS